MKESVAEFVDALNAHAAGFNVRLSASDTERLGDYYEIVMAWNPRLHLVAPCTALEFAVRHVLESLAALRFLTSGAHVSDVGSGAGLPIIPCLIVRADLRATLVESSQKKAVFLREALRAVEANRRAEVIAKRFEEMPSPETDFVTCRALDRFTEMFEKLLAWSGRSGTLLFFGGQSLEEKIRRAGLNYQPVLIPESERRFLFVIKRKGDADE